MTHLSTAVPLASQHSYTQFRRFATQLFDQQCWCWGQDIKRQQGNVLLELGMCRYRPADASSGSSLYTAAVESGGQVWLWGFGCAYSEANRGSVFLRRFDFVPQWSPTDNFLGIHEANRLLSFQTPIDARVWQTARTLLVRLTQWIAHYEHWIAENLSVAYREECLRRRQQKPIVPAAEIASSWEFVARKCTKWQATESSVAGKWSPLLNHLRARLRIDDARLETRGCSSHGAGPMRRQREPKRR